MNMMILITWWSFITFNIRQMLIKAHKDKTNQLINKQWGLDPQSAGWRSVAYVTSTVIDLLCCRLRGQQPANQEHLLLKSTEYCSSSAGFRSSNSNDSLQDVESRSHLWNQRMYQYRQGGQQSLVNTRVFPLVEPANFSGSSCSLFVL